MGVICESSIELLVNNHDFFSFNVLIRQIVLLIPASATHESPVFRGASDSMFPKTDINRNTSDPSPKTPSTITKTFLPVVMFFILNSSSRVVRCLGKLVF